MPPNSTGTSVPEAGGLERLNVSKGKRTRLSTSSAAGR